MVITSDTLGFSLANHNGRLAIQSDQKIIVSGGAILPTDTRYSMAAARFNLDGSFDTAFNPSGPWPGIATSGYGFAYAVVIQPGDGKIVLAGHSTADGVNPNTTLARLNPDGTVDTSFGGGTGYVVQSLSAYGDEARGLALQPDGKIVTAGPIQDQTGSWNIGLAVARFLNGAPTTTTLASSANPSVSGQSVTFTATVSTTGTVSRPGPCSSSTARRCWEPARSSTANGITTATLTTTTLAVGTHSITAVYGGDSNDMGNTSTVLSQVVNSTASTSLITIAAPSAMPMTAGAPSSPGSFIVPLAPVDFDLPGELDRSQATAPLLIGLRSEAVPRGSIQRTWWIDDEKDVGTNGGPIGLQAGPFAAGLLTAPGPMLGPVRVGRAVQPDARTGRVGP